MSWKWSSKGTGGEAGDWTGFLDEGVRLEGTLEVSGTFHLSGKVKGTIISHQSLILGDRCQAEGQIEGNHVVVGGRFEGVIFAKGRVEVKSQGVVRGEIHTPCLVVEAGGIFDGRCHMLASAEAAKPLTIPIRAVQS